MPIEPVTPQGSRLWRLIHLPVTLAIVAVGLLFVAALAIRPVSLGFRSVTIPGVRFLLPLLAMAVTVAVYWVFVRFVERRRDMEELDAHGAVTELALGAGGGLVLSGAIFAILYLLGGIAVLGVNPPETMLLPFVVQSCTSVILELVVCGLGFRLIERLCGSWIALLATICFFGLVRMLSDDATPSAVFAVALEAVLLFALLYMVTRRLWAAIGVYAAWKIAQIGLYGNALPGARPRGIVLSDLDGPEWLTGGQTGTDTSLPALVAAALLVTILIVIAVRRGQIVRPVWQRGRIRAR